MKDMDSSLANYHMMQGSKYLKNTKMPYDNHLTKQFRETGAVICENLQHRIRSNGYN